MEQKIIIKRERYYTESENGESISKIKMDFRNTHFSTYDPWKDYLHIQVGGYDDFNFYIELTPREAEKMFSELAEKARKMNLGF